MSGHTISASDLAEDDEEEACWWFQRETLMSLESLTSRNGRMHLAETLSSSQNLDGNTTDMRLGSSAKAETRHRMQQAFTAWRCWKNWRKSLENWLAEERELWNCYDQLDVEGVALGEASLDVRVQYVIDRIKSAEQAGQYMKAHVWQKHGQEIIQLATTKLEILEKQSVISKAMWSESMQPQANEAKVCRDSPCQQTSALSKGFCNDIHAAPTGRKSPGMSKGESRIPRWITEAIEKQDGKGMMIGTGGATRELDNIDECVEAIEDTNAVKEDIAEELLRIKQLHPEASPVLETATESTVDSVGSGSSIGSPADVSFWNPNIRCGQYLASERAEFCMVEWGMTLEAARQQVMSEFSVEFFGIPTPGWDPEVVCDGEIAAARSMRLVETENISLETARKWIMDEFPREFQAVKRLQEQAGRQPQEISITPTNVVSASETRSIWLEQWNDIPLEFMEEDVHQRIPQGVQSSRNPALGPIETPAVCSRLPNCIMSTFSTETYEVVASGLKGGLLVRLGVMLDSPLLASRLEVGSLVQKLEVRGNRVHYRLVSGRGPKHGWLSATIGNKIMLEKR